MFQIFKMADGDDSNSCFEMFGSQGDKKTFEKVPEDTIFKIKVVEEAKTKHIGYKLMEGVDLPCDKIVAGQ